MFLILRREKYYRSQNKFSLIICQGLRLLKIPIQYFVSKLFYILVFKILMDIKPREKGEGG